MLKLKLQRFAEDVTSDDNSPHTVNIGGKDYTLDEVAERFKSYDKLQAQFTKVSQEASTMRDTHQAAQEWLNFDAWVRTLSPELQNEYGGYLQQFINRAQTGTVTQQSITDLNKVIRAAEKAGDDKAADALKEQRDEALEEYRFDKTIRDLGKEAKKEGIEFDEDDFTAYLKKYLEDEELVEEDGSFDDRYIKVAYRLYKVDKKEQLLEKERKERLPDLESGGAGIGVGGTKQNDRPKTLREAHERAMKRLGVR